MGLATAEFNINPIGSGPYQFDQLTLNQGQITGVVLKSFENYYGKKPFIPQVVFRYFPSSAAALDAYEQGEVLGISRITKDVLNEALAQPNLSVYTSRLPQLSMVMLNLNNPGSTVFAGAEPAPGIIVGTEPSAYDLVIVTGAGHRCGWPDFPRLVGLLRWNRAPRI
jgi:peptide/nickel transport system substrate-binding protein